MIEWIDMVTKGAAVKRFHTCPTIGNETVGEHSFSVVMLCLALTGGKASTHLMKAALYHDLAEQHTSDVSAVAKWANPILKAALDAMEETFNENNGLVINLPKQDQLVLKWADMLALLIYCKCQRDLGNKNMNVVFSRGVEALSNLERLPEGQLVLNWLVENYAL